VQWQLHLNFASPKKKERKKGNKEQTNLRVQKCLQERFPTSQDQKNAITPFYTAAAGT